MTQLASIEVAIVKPAKNTRAGVVVTVKDSDGHAEKIGVPIRTLTVDSSVTLQSIATEIAEIVAAKLAKQQTPQLNYKTGRR